MRSRVASRSPPRRIRTRRRSAALVVAVALGGCGGEAGREEASDPRLPAALAQDLAERSDRVAELLAGGDGCGASAQADALLAAVVAAVNEGDVPRELAEELAAAANGLAERIECTSAPPPPPPPPPPPATDPATTAEEEDDDEEDEQPEETTEEDGGEEPPPPPPPPPPTDTVETVPTEPETVPTDTGGETTTTGTTTEETP